MVSTFVVVRVFSHENNALSPITCMVAAPRVSLLRVTRVPFHVTRSVTHDLCVVFLAV